MLAQRAICLRHGPRRASINATQTLVATSAAPWLHANRRSVHHRSSHAWPPPRRAGAGDPALELFNDVVSARKNASKAPRQDASGLPSEVFLAGSIKTILRNSQLSPEQKMKQFEKEIWPYIVEVQGNMPETLNTLVLNFFRTLGMVMLETGQSRGSSIIVHMMAKLGAPQLEFRNDLILNMCHELACGPSDGDASRAAAPASPPVDVRELIALWKEISQLNRASIGPRDLEFELPTKKHMQTTLHSRSPAMAFKGPQRQIRPFTLIFPQYTPQEAKQLVPGLLATAAILSDPQFASPEILQEAAPLLSAVAFAVEESQFKKEGLRAMISKQKSKAPVENLKRIESYVADNWQRMLSLLNDEGKTWTHALLDPYEGKSVRNSHTRLQAAFQARNIGAIVMVWDELVAVSQQSARFLAELNNKPKFLDYAVFILSAIRRPDKLQEALDLMGRLDFQPTTRTYTSMMHGWKLCKDMDRIKALWERLVASGVKLDLEIWTERISALTTMGKTQEAINALGEMMTLWKDARDSGQEHTAVKPTIEVVNATLEGLLRTSPKVANEVLAWAGREGIQPNVTTYNITLQQSLRSGQAQDVEGILRAMQAHGVEPDSFTFTIIMQDVAGSLGKASAEEQVHAVRTTFSDMEAAGLKPKQETYTKMLHAISGLPNGADAAIDEVLAHMKRNGAHATPHVITIKIDRHLARTYTNVADGITKILREHKLTSIAQGDQTLWERVASAYAMAHRPDEALRIFRELAAAGRPMTSLPSLTAVLKELLTVNRKADAAEVVDVVLKRKMKAGDEGEDEMARDRYWRHHFWHVANEAGLLTKEAMPLDLWQRLNGPR